MEIKVHLPSAFEAEVKYDAATRVVTITPGLAGGNRNVNLCGVEVVGKSGRRTRSLVAVSGAKGILGVRRVGEDPKPTAFDGPETKEDSPKAS